MGISLVTGGSGFIGQHLVQDLVAHGEKVRILDPEPPDMRLEDVAYVQGSVTDARLVKEAMDGVVHVYHTAAISDLWIPDPAMFHEINAVGTRVILEAAFEAGVERVVHTSSGTVLIDDRIGRMPRTLDETYQTNERGLAGAYARSKWQAEKVATNFMEKLPIVIVLPTLPLGPGDRRLTPPSRMLLDFSSGRIEAYIDCILNIIDVRDAAAGHRLACARGRPGRRYILNGHSLSMVSFLSCLETLTNQPMPKWRISGKIALAVSAVMEFWSNRVSGQPPIAPLAGTRTSLRPVIFDGRLAKTELGLPSTSLEKTLSDAIGWLVQAGRLPKEKQRSTVVARED